MLYNTTSIFPQKGLCLSYWTYGVHDQEAVIAGCCHVNRRQNIFTGKLSLITVRSRTYGRKKKELLTSGKKIQSILPIKQPE